jgi:toxin YoeB
MREDLAYWIRRQPRTALRVIDLAEAVMRDPYTGIGKPEPLKHRGSDLWSRRVTDVDRLVYLVQAGRVVFLQARGHYTRT